MRLVNMKHEQQVSQVISQQTDRLWTIRFIRRRYPARIEGDDAKVTRQCRSLPGPNLTTGGKPRNQNNRLTVAFNLVVKLEAVY